MALRKLIKIGDDALRKKTHPITAFDKKLSKLLDDMYDTMVSEEGAGIAAPQVGILRRVVVIEVEGERLDLVNPEIIFSEGEIEDTEGCLSIPGKRYKLKRPAKVIVRAFNRKGEPFERTGEGYLARAICHELDHLDGVLFIDLVSEEELSRKQESD